MLGVGGSWGEGTGIRPTVEALQRASVTHLHLLLGKTKTAEWEWQRLKSLILRSASEFLDISYKSCEGLRDFFSAQKIEVLHVQKQEFSVDGNEEFLCLSRFKDAVAHARQFAD